MAKDPAFLWYPNDYCGGVMGWNFEEKGAYVDLLMMQFNRGHMTTHMIGQILGQSMDKLWPILKDKFKTDAQGLFYNARLEEEINNRKSFVKSRYNNLSGKNQYTKDVEKLPHMDAHMTSHMENENENINEDINKDKEGVIGGENNHTNPESKPKTWRNDFGLYLSGLMEVYNQLIIDPAFIRERERYHPTLDISLSLEKAVNDFWGLEAGWEHKKSKRTKDIDWKRTLKEALNMPSNQVKKQYSTITKPKNERFEVNFNGNQEGTILSSARIQ